MFRSVSTSCSNTKLSKLYRLKEEEQKNREKLENKYNQLDESVKQWDKMYFNPFNALLEKHGVKIISDVKTASDNDIKTYIEMTKLFIQGLITALGTRPNNDQLQIHCGLSMVSLWLKLGQLLNIKNDAWFT